MRKSPNSVSGIYAITCFSTGKTYVGRSRSIQARWMSHRRLLAAGTHRNRHLQRAWDKYGADNFGFRIVEIVVGCTLEETEALLCAGERRVLASYPDTFNLMTVGEPTLTASDETRAIWSAQRKAMWADPAFKERMRQKHRAKHQDPEFRARRAKAIAAGKGRPDARAKMAAATAARWAAGEYDGQGERVRELWKTPEHRAIQKDARMSAAADPAVRERRSAGLRAAFARKRAKTA